MFKTKSFLFRRFMFKNKELSFRRFYSNTYTDAEKQDAINLFLGNFIPELGQPAIWELDSDYYLHSRTWTNPGMLTQRERRRRASVIELSRSVSGTAFPHNQECDERPSKPSLCAHQEFLSPNISSMIVSPDNILVKFEPASITPQKPVLEPLTGQTECSNEGIKRMQHLSNTEITLKKAKDDGTQQMRGVATQRTSPFADVQVSRCEEMHQNVRFFPTESTRRSGMTCQLEIFLNILFTEYY